MLSVRALGLGFNHSSNHTLANRSCFKVSGNRIRYVGLWLCCMMHARSHAAEQSWIEAFEVYE